MNTLQPLDETEIHNLSRRLKNTDAEWRLIDALGEKFASLQRNLSTLDRNMNGKLSPVFNPVPLLQEVNDLLNGAASLHDFLHAAAQAKEKI